MHPGEAIRIEENAIDEAPNRQVTTDLAESWVAVPVDLTLPASSQAAWGAQSVSPESPGLPALR